MEFTRRKILWMIGGMSAYLAVPAPVLPKSLYTLTVNHFGTRFLVPVNQQTIVLPSLKKNAIINIYADEGMAKLIESGQYDKIIETYDKSMSAQEVRFLNEIEPEFELTPYLSVPKDSISTSSKDIMFSTGKDD